MDPESGRTDDTPRGEQQRDLDQALENTFPASDPPAMSGITGPEGTGHPPAPPAACDIRSAESAALDEALEETFPASDPPALTLKHGRDDGEPECPAKD